MGTYDYEGDGAELGTFGTIKITKVDGSEVDLTEAALNEQRSYFEDLSSDAGFSLADVNIDTKSIEGSIILRGLKIDDIILKIWKLCNVEYLLSRNINSLSGGELKRVQLAKTLVQLYSPSSKNEENKYALLDEPLANLDLFYEIDVLKIIRNVSREQGLGIMLIIHDLNLAAKFSNKVALLHLGEIKDFGKPKDVLRPSILKMIYNMNMKVEKNPFRVIHY